MKIIINMITNPRVASAIVSAVSAVICVIMAGCKLTCEEFGVKGWNAEIFSFSTNSVPGNVNF